MALAFLQFSSSKRDKGKIKINVFVNYGQCSEGNTQSTLTKSDECWSRWDRLRPEVQKESSFVKGEREGGDRYKTKRDSGGGYPYYETRWKCHRTYKRACGRGCLVSPGKGVCMLLKCSVQRAANVF